ncbi:hypothetical protein [Microvirga alba]|uniref:hypothetical protein n=1 Tax=Microvirga alba TaxID=2791025 RepID=UPI001E563777|nr:hypothetical protein [Microvirga alba]
MNDVTPFADGWGTGFATDRGVRAISAIGLAGSISPRGGASGKPLCGLGAVEPSSIEKSKFLVAHFPIGSIGSAAALGRDAEVAGSMTV